MTRPALVVDASVVTKWLLPEVDDEPALRLQDQYDAGELDLFAPSLLLLEVASALWKWVRRGALRRPAAEGRFRRLLLDVPILLDTTRVTESAYQLALAHDQPVYDCLYLALALDLRCDIVTADRKFFAAMHRTYGCLRLLREVGA